MKQKEKLYFKKWYCSEEHYNGSPIFYFEFIRMNTNEVVALPLCDVPQSSVRVPQYYQSMEEMSKDYDILWFITDITKGDIMKIYYKQKLLLQHPAYRTSVIDAIDTSFVR